MIEKILREEDIKRHEQHQKNNVNIIIYFNNETQKNKWKKLNRYSLLFKL